MFKNIKVKTSLLGILILFACLQFLSNSVSIFFLNENQQNISLLNSSAKEQKALNRVRDAILNMRDRFDEVQATLRSSNSINGAQSIAIVKNDIKTATEAFDNFLRIPGLTSQDPQLANTMKQAFNGQMMVVHKSLTALENFTTAEIFFNQLSSYKTEQNAARAEFDKQYEGYINTTDAVMASSVNQSRAAYQTLWGVTVALLVMVVALFISSLTWLNRVLIIPLRLLSTHLARVGNGDLSHPIEISSKNEVGQLFSALQDMQGGLIETVKTIRDGVGSIHIGTQEIATGNTDLSSRTEEQSAAIVQTAASMEQISSTVKHNADNAQQASHMISESARMAREGEQLMHDMVEKIHTISHNAQGVSAISNVIDSIAFQTNILALNAAVEAARAGESGRGFAVVASEVRNLAQRSAASAKEINALIAQAGSTIGEGVSLANHSGEMMAKISGAISHVNNLMDDISTASDEQSRGVEQIRVAITQMEQVTQQNAALVEEVATTATYVEEQATQLAQSVAIFQLSAGEKQLIASRHTPMTKNTPPRDAFSDDNWI